MRLGLAAALPGEGPTYLKVRNLDIQVAYLSYNTSWTAGMLSSSWLNACAGAAKAILSVPMLVGPQTGTPVAGSGSGQTLSPQNPSNANTPTTMTLADVAAGAWDTLFSAAFATAASIRPDCILRIGWEQYGNGWYPWNGAALISDYAAAYKHLVTLARAQSASFQFDWNGNVAFASYDPTVAYAAIGSAYVDFMTTDVYNATSPGGAAGWAAYQSSVLTNALNFAISQGKPFGLSELGTFAIGFSSGFGDDPAWMEAAYYWLKQNAPNIAYACWFQNFAGGPTTDGSGALQRNPNMATVFSALFGSWAQENAGLTSHRFVSSGSNRLRVR